MRQGLEEDFLTEVDDQPFSGHAASLEQALDPRSMLGPGQRGARLADDQGDRLPLLHPFRERAQGASQDRPVEIGKTAEALGDRQQFRGGAQPSLLVPEPQQDLVDLFAAIDHGQDRLIQEIEGVALDGGFDGFGERVPIGLERHGRSRWAHQEEALGLLPSGVGGSLGGGEQGAGIGETEAERAGADVHLDPHRLPLSSSNGWFWIAASSWRERSISASALASGKKTKKARSLNRAQRA